MFAGNSISSGRLRPDGIVLRRTAPRQARPGIFPDFPDTRRGAARGGSLNTRLRSIVPASFRELAGSSAMPRSRLERIAAERIAAERIAAERIVRAHGSVVQDKKPEHFHFSSHAGNALVPPSGLDSCRALRRGAAGLSCRMVEETAMIDMHAHWKPAEVADALRARTKEPRILANPDGVEVLKSRMGEEPLANAFDDVDFHLARMGRQGVETSVLSLLGSFCWIESQPPEVSGPLCRRVNDRLSAICQEHPGRFAAFAALPLTDIGAAAAELERALGLSGMIGAQVPGNFFLTRADAEAARPLLEVANRHHAVLFIHHGPRPGDAFPRVTGDTDNSRRRNGTLDMQASLSSVMVTLCLTDLLAPYPDVTAVVHNLGGNIPYEVERMDHRSLLDTPQEELPSSRFRKANVYVDCNSFGPGAIEAAVRLYGAGRIVCGTDGTAFGVDWTRKALADARIGEEERELILHRNATAMLARVVTTALGERATA
jgi:predicted TIM-barrel fold metal-dependent hydrolase